MKTYSPRINHFLEETRMHHRFYTTKEMIPAFDQEMSLGLNGKEGGFAMLPSYISNPGDFPRREPVVLIDAGGTNLRVTLMHFDDEGRPVIDYFEKYPMPGTDRELSAREFFDRLADYLLPVADKSRHFAFCFSYPTEITPDKDGILLQWTKEIKVPQVVGQPIGKNLREALSRKTNHSIDHITLLNDSTATLLAGLTVPGDFSDYVGFIAGTGTNTAYFEKNSQIPKVDLSDGFQGINLEAADMKGILQGNIDREFDAATASPGTNMMEKMITGAYLGPLSLHLFKAAARAGLFSRAAADEILATSSMETRYLDGFLDPTREIFFKNMTDDDRWTASELADNLVERGAVLGAVSICTPVIRAWKNHPDDQRHICITADGSTFEKLPSFRHRIEAKVASTLGERGIRYKIVTVDNAPVMGTAIAGLTT